MVASCNEKNWNKNSFSLLPLTKYNEIQALSHSSACRQEVLHSLLLVGPCQPIQRTETQPHIVPYLPITMIEIISDYFTCNCFIIIGEIIILFYYYNYYYYFTDLVKVYIFTNLKNIHQIGIPKCLAIIRYCTVQNFRGLKILQKNCCVLLSATILVLH